MEAPPLKSIVSVNTFANGRAEIVVSGAGGTFTLEVLPMARRSALKIRSGETIKLRRA